MNARKSKWLGLWTAGWCLASTLPAGAVITAVTPPEGTVGMEFTISGTDFGDKRGKVDLGEEMCKVLSWSDTAVTCEIRQPQPAGDYTITLWPQGSKKKNVPQTYAPFTMRQPYIDLGEPMRLITPLEVVTITGDFFGDKQGRVGMRDTTGLTLEARVFNWSMNSITFEVPEGLTGTVILGVRNDVGLGIQRFWGTFTPLPARSTLATKYRIARSHENATGISFNNQFWIFYTEPNTSDDKANDILAVWFDPATGTIDTSAPDPDGESDSQLAPIVIDHELWLFHTGESGQLFFKRYAITGKDEANRPVWGWQDFYTRIIGTGTDPLMELAPVWNPNQNRIEVYYWNSNSIYMVYSYDKGATWSTTKKIEGLGTVSTAPTAVYWPQTADSGVTLLAFTSPGNPDINDSTMYVKVYETKDGALVKTAPVWWSSYRSGQPHLAHLGEDYIGVLYENGSLDTVDCAKMSKETGVWNYNPLTPYLTGDVIRVPSMSMNAEEQEDLDAPLKVRYNAVAYVFSDDSNGVSYLTPVEQLGWWQEEGATDLDVGSSATRAQLFNTWPVVGVVDAPPYILNGGHYSEECDPWICNSLVFGTAETNSTTFSYDLKVGVYVETGGKFNPVKAELKASFHDKFDSTESTTVEIESSLYRSRHGTVSVFYLIPTFRTHHIQWYDLTGEPSGNWIEHMEVTRLQMASVDFDPKGMPFTGLIGMPPTYFEQGEGKLFPYHAVDDETAAGDRERLMTYSAVPPPEFERWFYSSDFWDRYGDTHIRWVQSKETSQYLGADIEWKIGVDIMDYFGVGTMGSFKFGWNTSVTVETIAQLFMVPGLEDGEPIHSFLVDAYWLKPNSTGYWVPLNRRGLDAPWFITYRISGIDPPQ